MRERFQDFGDKVLNFLGKPFGVQRYVIRDVSDQAEVDKVVPALVELLKGAKHSVKIVMGEGDQWMFGQAAQKEGPSEKPEEPAK